MSNLSSLRQYEQQTLSLMAERKFNDAYKICVSVLKNFPDHPTFKKLKREIESVAKEENEKFVKEKMATLDTLKRSGDIPAYLKELKKLISLSPQDRRLISEYEKAATEYQMQMNSKREVFINEKRNELTPLIKRDPSKLVDNLLKLERENPRDPEISILVKQLRTDLIKEKIRQKKDLIYSGKYEDIMHFILDLREIDRQNPLIDRLEMLTKKQTVGKKIEETKDFAYRGEQYLDTLIKLKKYEEAISLALEVLSLSPNSTFAKKALQTATKKFDAANKKAVIEKISAEKANLQKEYRSNKESFVRLF